MKIVWHSNAPWAGSGYGNQTDLFTGLMAQEGHDVKVSAFYGLRGAQLNLAENLAVLPGGNTDYGEDLLLPHWNAHRPDAMVILIDLWVFRDDILNGAPFCAWVPVDSDPIPPEVAYKLRFVRHPWAMSRFGERQMRLVGIEPHYVPHGIDTDTYAPMSAEDRAKAREFLGWKPDGFYFSSVAANKGYPSRKNLPGLLKAFGRLCEERDDVYLYLHTNPTKVHSGLDIDKMAKFYGIPEGRLILPNLYKLMMGEYLPKYLNLIYNASDAFILPSAGEGFGIPAVEAQAAGCPAVLTDHTAQTELCAPGGLLIPVDRMDDCAYTMLETEQAINLRPSVILQWMRLAIEKFKGDQGRRDQAREWALDYDYRTVWSKYMLPALEAAAQTNAKTWQDSAGKYHQLGFDYHWNPAFRGGHYEAWVEFVLSMLPDDRGANVLDVGCGDGYPAAKLVERGFNVHGVDPVQGALEVARKKVPNALFTADFPTEEQMERVDYVLALDSIEHMDDPALLVAAVERCRKFALIATPPPGTDPHAVKGYGVGDVIRLFDADKFAFSVLYLSDVDQLLMISRKEAKVAEEKDRLRIAVLSDCRVATTGDGAHGLGNSAYEIAAGLALERGHHVTLFAGINSEFPHGELKIDEHETARAQRLAVGTDCPFDVIIDCSHYHDLSRLRPDWAIINRVGDVECKWDPPNAIVATQYMARRYHGAKVIRTGIDLDKVPERNGTKRGDHLLFIGRMVGHKGVETAERVARAAGLPIVWAGANEGEYDVAGQYLGELRGDAKWKAMQSAKAMILPTRKDAAPRTPLEAAAAGVPSLVMAYDGAAEHVENGVTGFVCRDAEEMQAAIKLVDGLDSGLMREWVRLEHDYSAMIRQYEQAALDVMGGKRW